MELTTNIEGVHVKISETDYEHFRNKYIYVNSNKSKYPSLSINKKTISLHKYVICTLMGIEVPQKHVVDHINGDRYDARRENLRVVNYSQNNQNRTISTKTISGYRGVSRKNSNSKWQTYFGSKLLGFTETVEEGARLYDKYIIKFVHQDNPTNFMYSEDEKQSIINSDFQPKILKSKGEVQGYTLTPNGKLAVKLKGKHLGTFETIEEAQKARKNAVDALEKKRLNEQVLVNHLGQAIIQLSGKNSQNTFTIVDHDKWHELNKISWSLGNDGYARSALGQLHTVITKDWQRSNNDHVIDHIDRNKLNNQICNLRLVSRSDNNKNISQETIIRRSVSLSGIDRRPNLKRKYSDDEKLPKYVSRLEGVRCGYQVVRHPSLKNKQFTRNTISMEEKLKLALNYLRTAPS